MGSGVCGRCRGCRCACLRRFLASSARWHIDDDRSCQIRPLRIGITPAWHGGCGIFGFGVRRTLWKTLQGNSFQLLRRLFWGPGPGDRHVYFVGFLFVNVIVHGRAALMLLKKLSLQLFSFVSANFTINYIYFFIYYNNCISTCFVFYFQSWLELFLIL